MSGRLGANYFVTCSTCGSPGHKADSCPAKTLYHQQAVKQLAKGSQDPNIVKEVYGDTRSIAIMRLSILIGFLLLASFALGQSGGVFQGSTAIAGNGNVLRTVPHAQIVVCGYPSTGSSPCTNTVTTYTTPGIVTACPLNAPVLVPGTTTCSGTSDAAGNFSFIVAAGQNIAYYFKYLTTWYGPYVTSIGIGPSANFSSPPPLGDVTPNTVDATTVTAVGDGLFFQPQSNCIFEGADPTLHELEDVAGNLMWLPQGLGGPCTQILTYTPPPDGVSPTDKQVPAWDAASGAFTIQNQTTTLPTAAAQGQVLVATGAGTTYAAQNKNAVDVRDYGVDCTDTNDSTSAFAAAITAAGNYGKVVVPVHCLFRISGTPGVSLYKVYGLELEFLGRQGNACDNQGPNPSGIDYRQTYASGNTVLSIVDSQRLQFKNVTIYTNGGADNGILIDQDLSTPPITTRNDFYNVCIYNNTATRNSSWKGISVSPTSASNVENQHFYHPDITCSQSTATSSSSNGFGIAFSTSANQKNEIVDDFRTTNCSQDVFVDGGDLTVQFGLASNSYTNVGLGGFNDALYGFRTENATNAVSVSNPIGPHLIMHNDFAASLGTIVDCPSGCGQLTMINNQQDSSATLTVNPHSGGGGPLIALNNRNINVSPIGMESMVFPGPLNSVGSYSTWDRYWINFPLRLTPSSASVNGVSGTRSSPPLYFDTLQGTGQVYDHFSIQGVPNVSDTSVGLNINYLGSAPAYIGLGATVTGLKVGPNATTLSPTPAVSPRGTAGATSYSYLIQANTITGHADCGTTATTTGGNAILNSTNFIALSWDPYPGAVSYSIYRTASGGTPSSTGLIGTVKGVVQVVSPVGNTDVLGFADTGLAGDASTCVAGNTTGTLDASAAPQVLLPLSAGYVATAQGNIGYDTTAKNWHVWQNAADRLMAVINGAMVNGNCVKAVVSGSTVSLQDAGVACDAPPTSTNIAGATTNKVVKFSSGNLVNGSCSDSGTTLTCVDTSVKSVNGVTMYVDQFASSCTPGTNDNACIAAAIAAISGTPGSGGGYGVIDDRGVTGAQIWTSSPFAAIISNGTTNFTAPQKCGVLMLNGGSAITMNRPLAVPRCWKVMYDPPRAEVQTPVASSTWPGVYNTGTIANNGASLISASQYQFTVTGTGTAFTTNVVPGEIFAVCQSNGANGVGCGGPAATFSNGSAIITSTNSLVANQPVQFVTTGTLPTNFSTKTTYYVISTGLSGSQFEVAATIGGAAIVAGSAGSGTHLFNSYNTCTATCGASAYGMVLAVTDDTHLIVGTNNTGHGNANAGGVQYVTYAPLVQLGVMGAAGGDAGGVSAQWVGGTLSCNDKPGCVDMVVYSQQEIASVRDVVLNHSINAFLDIEGNGSVNSGPFDNIVINGDGNCVAGTIGIISRVLAATRPVQNVTVNMDSAATCGAISVDWESQGQLAHMHHENIGGANDIVVSVGDNVGALSKVLCPTMCVEPPNSANGAHIQDVNSTGIGLTGIDIGSAATGLISLLDDNFSQTNAFVDNFRGCTQVNTGGDGTILFYERNTIGTWFGTAGSPTNACASSQLGYDITAAMGAQTSATQTAITNMSFPLTASKYYKLRCDIPVVFAASATIAFGFTGTSNPASYDLSFSGNIGAAAAFQKVDFTGQTTWVSGATNSGASGAPGGTHRITLEASILNSANTQTVTLGTVANGTNSITVSGRADCQLNQLN